MPETPRLNNQLWLLLLLLALLSPSLAWTTNNGKQPLPRSLAFFRPAAALLLRSVSIPGEASEHGGSSSDDEKLITVTGNSNAEKCVSTSTSLSSGDGDSATTVNWNWQAVATKAFIDDTRPIILFDGVCLFCNAGVDLTLSLDTQERFRFASLQSKVGQSLLLQHGKQPHDLSSIVLVESLDEASFESDAILKIARELKGLPKVLRFLSKASLKVVPLPIRNGAYHVVANNRYLFGHTEECRLDLDGVLARRFVEEPAEDGDNNLMMREASANAAAL